MYNSRHNCLTISIDFDDTFTAAPQFWTQFILLAQAAGHIVVCITARQSGGEQEFDVHRTFRARGISNMRVLCTSGKSKRAFAEANNLLIDIWIDDMPEMIV